VIRKQLPFSTSSIRRWIFLGVLFLVVVTGFWSRSTGGRQTALAADHIITGRVLDEQGTPIAEAVVMLYTAEGTSEPAQETHTQRDGSYILVLSETDSLEHAHLQVERAHFASHDQTLDPADLRTLQADGSLVLADIILARHYGAAFWITAATFALMLVLIATERLHKTLVALLATAIILGVSLVGGSLTESLYIFDFELALEYVDFDVIFLLMGMMIVIAVIEETGIFQWLAYQAYRLSRGRVWLLSIILMVITAVASALLDNVTTMLLMAPITLQIALAVGINPLSLLLPEVLASNVGGISTLIGTPTNILIGSYAGLGFNDFVTNLTPGVIMAQLGLIGYTMLRYRKEYAHAGGGLSEALLNRLRENARIEDYRRLTKAGIVFIILLGLFIFGERIHLAPAVSAIMGAVAMLIWVNPDIEQMMTVVDWTTLMFFIGLFMVIGAVQEVGLIALIATGIGNLVGSNLMAAILAVAWMGAIISGVVDNIPFAAAMLPVVGYLTRTIPGASNDVLFYALSIGAAMGGNSSLIGASANLVTAGIAARAGYPISFKKFLIIGLPSVLVTVAIGCIWLFIRF
jgi:Na+/H+ antiporter NhaD/arsenite permease-like protein